MKQALDLFVINFGYARELGVLHKAVRAITTEVLNLDDLLRSQLVMAVSAMDTFAHDVARLGILEICTGTRPPTDASLRTALSLQHLNLATLSMSLGAIEQQVIQNHSYLSFQHPDKFADAIRIAYPKPIWPEVASILGTDAKSLKERVGLIVDRRNKIAHEADRDPTYPDQRWPIHVADVDDSLDLIESVCKTVATII